MSYGSFGFLCLEERRRPALIDDWSLVHVEVASGASFRGPLLAAGDEKIVPEPWCSPVTDSSVPVEPCCISEVFPPISTDVPVASDSSDDSTRSGSSAAATA
jgi:hypothetical protein